MLREVWVRVGLGTVLRTRPVHCRFCSRVGPKPHATPQVRGLRRSPSGSSG